MQIFLETNMLSVSYNQQYYWRLINIQISQWIRTWRVSSQAAGACHLLTYWFLLKLFLRPWRWRRYVPPKRRLQLNRLHDVTSQKTILFITTAVKTSNPTNKNIFTKVQ
jgi:hypothetical protein